MEIWLNESKRILNGSKRVMNESKDVPNESKRPLNESKDPSNESNRINLCTDRPKQKQQPFLELLIVFARSSQFHPRYKHLLPFYYFEQFYTYIKRLFFLI